MNTTEPDLFGDSCDLRLPEKQHAFGGATYEPERDYERLGAQVRRVWDLMRDGQWRTLEAIADATGDVSVASISARLRDLRKEKFGGHQVERKHLGEGLFAYRVIVGDSYRENAE